jgi:hypothetical protein
MSDMAVVRAYDALIRRLFSDFVEAIQHFDASQEHHSAQRDDQQRCHFCFPPGQPEQATRLLLGRR